MGMEDAESGEGSASFDEYGYADFTMPWSLKLAITCTTEKRLLTSDLSQNMTLNGSVTLTK